MIFGLFTLAVALTISAVAAYYSIAGLCAIFAAAVVPIIIMGAALELGKITATVWLHKYWHRCALQFKLYLVPAIVVLMIITSMGIFGFLSKAHMDQGVTVGDSAAQVAIFDEKIRTEKDNIEANRKALQQMDAQVDQLLGRTDDDKGANRAVQVRRQQAKERKTLQAEISQAQKNISALQAERAPLAAQTRKIEAEVGPVKYIAALIYGDNPDANLLERAVRWVIILLVLVFDPLALVLILAAEQTIEWARADRKPKKAEGHPSGWHQEWVPDSERWPKWEGETTSYELDDGPLTDEQLTKIIQEANVDDDIEMKQFFEDGKELAKAIDNNDGKLPDDYAKSQSYLTKPWTWFKSDTPVETPLADNQIEIPDFSINAEYENQSRPTNANFGSSDQMPANPEKGDMFLRTDVLPHVLFKWNGLKWIEIPLTATDQYVYNPQYIDDLIQRIEQGQYSVDWLTESEQEQIQKVLNGKSNKQ